jgi:alcohol dehydrogenase class IV
MRTITFLQPNRLTIGLGCVAECISYVQGLNCPSVHIISSPSLWTTMTEIARSLISSGCIVSIDAGINKEPTISMFEQAVAKARDAKTTCVLGIGGGSVLDVAKLVAAFVDNDQNVEETFGIDLLRGRHCHLVCMPTTAGTGSEVSPNAILLDEQAKLKKGVISPYLVPDATFIDPRMTQSMSPEVTAFTGLDALTHCIEAYTNKFAHPLVDVYALQGISLCHQFLTRAVRQPDDLEAREGMSLASLYGGLCLGPVNSAAVHALAYPLGGEFHVPHGLSNAPLLPHVFRFNAQATPDRHAAVAIAVGVRSSGDDLDTAYRGADRLKQLAMECDVFAKLSRYNIGRSAIPSMAKSAMTVTRLLKNNPRDIDEAACLKIYSECFQEQ